MPTDDVHYIEKMTTWFEIFIQVGRDLSISLSKLYITSLVYITIETDPFFFLDKITHLLNLVLCQVIIKREKKRN